MAGAKNKSDADSEYDRQMREYHDNRVAFYSNWVGAWIENRMEKDKQLLTLSALAIGLLVSVFNSPNNICEFWILVFAGISFLGCILIILIIFSVNAKYIEIILTEHQKHNNDGNGPLGNEESKKAAILNKLTITAFSFFISGALLTSILTVMRSGVSITIGNI